MAQTGFTPIKLYYSPTAAAVPLAANLAAGELALNTTDGKLYYKTTGGVVTLLAGATAGPAGGSNTQVQYNSSGSLAGSANLTFDGSNLETYSTVTARASSGTSAFRLRNTTSDYQWQTVAGTNAVVLYDNAVGSGRVTLDSTGNLGIGTSSPGSALEVKRTSGNAEIAVNYNDTNKGRIVAASNGNVYIGTSVGAGAVVIGNTANADAVTLLSSGNLGIGTSSPGAKLDVQGGSSAIITRFIGGESNYTIRILNTANTGGGSINANTGAGSGITLSSDSGPMIFYAASSERMRLDLSGNLLVGTTSGTDKLTVDGGATFKTGSTSVLGIDYTNASNSYGSAIARILGVSRNTVTGRSIGADGTINASGADYAEYMTKAGDFTITKGDVVGINSDGKLTNSFVDAVSFVVKSTDPSYVGNDKWGVGFKEDAEGLEVARQKVDRIAFAGQVPVNVIGAVAGQYIIPFNDNGAIRGQAISNPTFEQYQQSVGKVIAIEQDGRARIIVKVA